MATGSGTGTPTTVINTTSLASLRNRVRVQVDKASGLTEALVVTASTIQLATGTPNFRDRLESMLQDASNLKWSTDDLDEAIRQALEQYTLYDPVHAITTVELSSDGREIDISAVTNLLRVEKVWWDYDSATPGYPPNWRKFDVWPGSILYIDDDAQPASGDTLRIWYTKPHTLNGLDSATVTTIPLEDIGFLIGGAASYAAKTRAIELSESLNLDSHVVTRLNKYADDMESDFKRNVRRQLPAKMRNAFAYSQDDIDEAIRWALHRYSEISPDRVITSLELSSSGREIDISTITDRIDIERMWWDYDSSNPAHPPNFRDFELWPDNIVCICDTNEPASGDVVRIWYTRLHTLNGLDSATVTSLPFDAETLIVIGASGFATQEHVLESDAYRLPTKLALWAEARLREFERGLTAVSSRRASQASGIASIKPLDRWENGGW